MVHNGSLPAVNVQWSEIWCAIEKLILSRTLIGEKWLWKLGGHIYSLNINRRWHQWSKLKILHLPRKIWGGGTCPPCLHIPRPCDIISKYMTIHTWRFNSRYINTYYMKIQYMANVLLQVWISYRPIVPPSPNGWKSNVSVRAHVLNLPIL